MSHPALLELDYELQKGVYVALELLRMLRRLHRNPRQLPYVTDGITTVAQWLNFLADQREQAWIRLSEHMRNLARLLRATD